MPPRTADAVSSQAPPSIALGPAPQRPASHPVATLPSVRAPRAPLHRRRAPARRPGRKEHHCARDIWAHERSSRSPSRRPSSSASPRRPRPPHRPRRRPSRSSGSPRRSSVIPGATAPPARSLRLLRPRPLRLPQGRRRRVRSTPAPALGPGDLPLVQGRAARPAARNPKIGDLVIWGGGTHIGIYIGSGKAISTLTQRRAHPRRVRRDRAVHGLPAHGDVDQTRALTRRASGSRSDATADPTTPLVDPRPGSSAIRRRVHLGGAGQDRGGRPVDVVLGRAASPRPRRASRRGPPRSSRPASSVPSRWTASMTARVRASPAAPSGSSPIPSNRTRTWLRTTSFRIATPRPRREALGHPAGMRAVALDHVDEAGPARATAAPPARRSHGPAATTRAPSCSCRARHPPSRRSTRRRGSSRRGARPRRGRRRGPSRTAR